MPEFESHGEGIINNNLDRLMSPSSLTVFTQEGNRIKTYQYDVRIDSPPQIPSEEEKIAEAVFLNGYNEKGGEQRFLRIDLYSNEEIANNVFRVIESYNQRFSDYLGWETERKKLVVMVNSPDGAVRVPFERLLEPSQNLITFLNKLPEILERRKVRYFLRNSIEVVKQSDEFLKCLYQGKDDEAKKLILSYLREKYHLTRESFKYLDYFDRILERLYSSLTSLRDRFLFNTSLLNLTEEELERRIGEIPATPNDTFIPLIERGWVPEKKSVSLSSIITAEAKETGTKGDKWLDYLIRRGENYMRKFLRACLRGHLNLSNPEFDGGYNLLSLGEGYYMVLNGRHRTVAAKLLGLRETEANVYNLLPEKGEKREVFPRNEAEIRRRISLGLIKGDFSYNDEGRIFLTVEEYEGPWVFYEDMEKAREFFNKTKKE